MVNHNFNVLAIRDDTYLKKFRSGLNRVIITTDLLFQGINFHGVSCIVNYELPSTTVDYIRRYEHFLKILIFFQ